jgi:hypothetical protein
MKQDEAHGDISKPAAESPDEYMASQSPTLDPPDSPAASRSKKRKKEREDGGSTKHKSKKLKTEH